MNFLSVFCLFGKCSCNINAAGGGVRQRMCDAAAVADDVEPLVLGFEVAIDLNLHIVEFYLYAVEEGIIVRRTRCNLIKGVNHFGDAV